MIKVLRSIHEVNAAEWNALQRQHQPFLSHEFLAALEDTGCAAASTGWTPQHLLLLQDGRLRGALPLYAKSHSYGEFVFDFSWAQSFDRYFQQAGQRYYPKLVCAVPFTPANGPRLLCAEDDPTAKQALLDALQALSAELNISSAHVLFHDATDQQALLDQQWLPRSSCQFHWFNRDYASMEDFLATFRADKRKKAHRERRRVLQEYGIHYRTLMGDELDDQEWQMVFSFSENTFHQHGHQHYLNAEFFQRVARALPQQVMVKLAEHHGRPVASAIFFLSNDTLFGRYWGAAGNIDSLHFETCYYQGIEFCIERGLRCFEPGTQGEHKIARGFEPTLCYSGHYVRDARFHDALKQHLAMEGQAVADYAAQCTAHLPFHRSAELPTAEPAS